MTLDRAEIDRRIHEAVAPVLARADALVESYLPDDFRVIGKHHPQYDTLYGRLHYFTRKLREFNDRMEADLIRLGIIPRSNDLR